ncbi:MAG: hypothetical protein RMK18_06835 [Armatimonadota bacterium]|nr:hypothetical protein [Armatimonadota bacterium]MCX7777555.1 hypothetical protein [Armatimonadota bacterium]MDW8025564.1 hypothetical protein [Armatimonadota bacterium]
MTGSLRRIRMKHCEMPKQSCSLPEALLRHPEAINLMAFVERLLQRQSSRISFVVIFGSAAKGT